jgi:hypothetical protein
MCTAKQVIVQLNNALCIAMANLADSHLHVSALQAGPLHTSKVHIALWRIIDNAGFRIQAVLAVSKGGLENVQTDVSMQ